MPRYEIADVPGRSWTLPSDFYTGAQAFADSREKIFARSWQYITDADHLKTPNWAHPFTLLEGVLDEPLMFTRDRDDKVHCLSNVCTHRGTLVCEGAGGQNSLRCRYHGRRFDLDGKFRSMPEFDEVENFPSESDNLAAVPWGKWRKFLFVSPNPAAPLDQVFAEIERRVGWMPIEEFVFAPERARDYMVKAHWALYVDNYLEGFHIPYIHASLNETLDYSNYTVEMFDYGNLQLGVSSGGEEVFDLPKSSPDYGRDIAAYYYWLFPNLMLNFYPWGLSINVVRPLAPDRTKVSFIPFVWDESKLGSGAGAELDRVEREDEAVVEAVQRGLRSRYYDRGRFSAKREDGVHQFHQMISAAMA